MLEKLRFYRILAYATIFFLLLVVLYNLIVFAYPRKDNLIALFYVRKDNVTNELHGEIYPIAFFSKGQYIDASIGVNDTKTNLGYYHPYLDKIRAFSIIEECWKLGDFVVETISTADFRCSQILIGRNKSKPDSSLLDIFNSINDSRASCSFGYKDKKEFNYSLKWTLAVSNYKNIHLSGHKTVKMDVARYKKDMLDIGKRLLTQYKSDGEDRGVEFEKMRIFDLDHDGYPEVAAKLKKPLQKITKIFRDGEEQEEYSNDTVYLNLWVNYKGGNPQIILSLISEEREGSWGTGHDLVGTADVNSDGIDEVIIRSSSGEVVDFEIYEYRNGRLERYLQRSGVRVLNGSNSMPEIRSHLSFVSARKIKRFLKLTLSLEKNWFSIKLIRK